MAQSAFGHLRPTDVRTLDAREFDHSALQPRITSRTQGFKIVAAQTAGSSCDEECGRHVRRLGSVIVFELEMNCNF